MNSKVLVGVLCSALCELATAATLYPHVPLVVWSQRSTFENTASYLSSALDESAVASTLQHAVSGNQGTEKSELLAVFLASKLRSEDVAKLSGGKSSSFVQGAVGAAASSAVIPHTTRASSLTHALNNGLVSFKEIPVEKLEEFLSGSEGKSVVSDGKTDLLVVRIGSEYTLPETDALIQAASEVLSTATKGSVDFALTGDEAEPKQISAPLARRRLASSANSTASAVVICETGLLVGYSGGKAFCFSHYVHMTPDLLTGLLFGFFFIFLAYVGLSALSAIQTPLRYPSHGPPRGKEF